MSADDLMARLGPAAADLTPGQIERVAGARVCGIDRMSLLKALGER